MKKKSPRSRPFIATRNHHVAETAEDYVEIISDLTEQKGEARTCDIAEQLGVSHVTVIRTIKRLEKKGLLVTKQHQPVVLTPEGEKLAEMSKKRHKFLMEYLTFLGVPEDIAEIDVEGIEHHISPATMEAFERQMATLSKV